MIFGDRSSIGLDIGSNYFKAVQLKEVRRGYELELLDILPVPTEIIVDGAIIDSLRLAEALKELIERSRIKSKDAVVGISGHASVIIKRISLPEMSEEDLAESIKFEAEQYIPFDIEDVNLDFQILGPREEQGQMDVLLVAVKKDIINEYVTVVKEAGLNPVIVDVDAFSLENMYEVNYEIEPNKNVALVNIGASTINMNILKGGISVFTRDSATGSNLHSEAIQKAFSVSYEIAERLKKGETVEGVTPNDAYAAMASATEDIINEIARSLDYYKSTTVHEEINEVILSGGGALVRDFSKHLSEKIGVESRVVEPFRNISIPKKFDISYIQEIAPIAAVAVGLALRRPGDR
ncbi:MAG: pilus assembly protein PilM [Nitrospiraceae bacterium]|nr:pilus assembly protein PilM [Nitrospiraceae bacterium]